MPTSCELALTQIDWVYSQGGRIDGYIFLLLVNINSYKYIIVKN